MRKVFRFSLYLLLTLYVVVVVGVSVLRFWVLPQINHWKAPIQEQLSSALGVSVEFEHISASWKGIHPRLELRGISWSTTPHSAPALRVPRVALVPSWRALLDKRIGFEHIEIEGLDVSLRRDAQAALYIEHIKLGSHPETAVTPAQDPRQAPLLTWLSQQPSVSIIDASLTWTDQLRGVTPVAINGLTLSLNSLPERHHLVVRSDNQDSGQNELLAIADIQPTEGQALSIEQVFGKLYVQMSGDSAQLWSRSLNLPEGWAVSLNTLELWADLEAGQMAALQLNAELEDLSMMVAEQKLEANRFSFSARGDWSSINGLIQAEAATDSALQFKALASQISIAEGPVWDQSIVLDQAAISGQWQGEVLAFNQLSIENSDFWAQASGEWSNPLHSNLGQLRLYGDLQRVELSSLYRYFPQAIDDDVTEWLRQSLVEGQAPQAKFVLLGELEDFPFSEQSDQGYFYVGAAIQNATVDYLPSENNEPSWPQVSQATGHLYIERAGLYADFHHALVEIDPEHPVVAKQIRVDIPDMSSEAVLGIHALTEGAAPEYLALMTRSPLGGILSHYLDDAQGDGLWRVPLSLRVPLLDTDRTTLSGEIQMEDASLQLMPNLPPFSDVKGSLGFNHQGVSSDDLMARWLGQAITIRGVLAPGESGLGVQATLDIAALQSYLGDNSLHVLSGQTPFSLNFSFSPQGQLLIAGNSTLQGISTDLPEPLSKKAEQRWPLHVSWTPIGDQSDYRLQARLGDELNAEFRYTPQRVEGENTLQAGIISTNTSANPPEKGMDIDVSYPRLNLDQWYEWIRSTRSNTEHSDDFFWPELRRLRLQSSESQMLGMPFSQLTFTAHRPVEQRWRVDLSSTELAGNVQWAVDDQGEIDGVLDAKLQRLVLWEPAFLSDSSELIQSDPPETDEAFFEGDLRLPDLTVEIDQLRVAGLNVGRFYATGEGLSHQNSWRLSTLEVAGPGLALAGSGTWRLSGPERGLGIDANIDVENLGEYFSFAGRPEWVQAGNGKVTATLNWQRLPWSIDLANLQADIDVDLNKGRLNGINSRSARLLELLSVQSLGRLASLDVNLSGVTQDGFPYDTLNGSIQLNEAMLTTQHYSVIGPVGAIEIEGNVGLKSERVDLNAVVVPKLDVSGAAIAAGVVVNPLLGVGAFLTQWLMQSPLSEAMTLRYSVDGDWNDLRIQEVKSASDKPRAEKEAFIFIEP